MKIESQKKPNIFKRIVKKMDSIQFGLDDEKEYFIENLSMLMAAGINVISALKSIKTGMRIPYMRRMIDGLIDDINEGSALWSAFQKTNLLPEHIISLFRIGELSGKLSENLKMINAQQQKERVFKAKIKSAMMYPVLVLTLTLVIGVGIAWFILPRLSTVFASLRLELPFITKMLIGLGNFLGEHGLVVIPIFFFFLFLTLYFVFAYERTKYIGQWILFHIPGINDLIQQTELSRFGYILGQLLSVNIPVVDTIESLRSSTTIIAYKKFYAHLQKSIESGNTFQKSFELYPKTDKLIPAPIQQMIASGEQSGCLSKLLLKIGEVFEEKTDVTTKNLSVILEPLLLVVVWGGVVSVALAVILPIYSLIGGIGKGPPPRPSTPPPAKVEVISKPEKKETFPPGPPVSVETQGIVHPTTEEAEPLKKVDIFAEEKFSSEEWTPLELSKTDGEAKAVITSTYEGLETVMEGTRKEMEESEPEETISPTIPAPAEPAVVSPPLSPEDREPVTEPGQLLPESVITKESKKIEAGELDKEESMPEAIPEKEFMEQLPFTQEPPMVIEEKIEFSEAVVPSQKIIPPAEFPSEIPYEKSEEPDQIIISDLELFPKEEKRESIPSIGIKEDKVVVFEPIPSVPGETQILRITPYAGTKEIKESELPPTSAPLPTLEVVPHAKMLNVRQYPTTNSLILKQIYPGTAYKYTDWKYGWYEIIYDEENKGWVSGAYIRLLNE